MNEKIRDLVEIGAKYKADFRELRAQEQALTNMRYEIASKIANEINTIQVTDEEVADEDFMDAFRDEVSNLAWSLGLTWAGEDSYDDFTPGEIDFWEASNC